LNEKFESGESSTGSVHRRIKPNLSQDQNQVGCRKRNWFILHPTGEAVTLSLIILPNGHKTFRSSQSQSGEVLKTFAKEQIDVGGKILQISACFDVDEDNQQLRVDGFEGTRKYFVVVRTPTHCCVLMCSPKEIHETILSSNLKENKDHQHFCTGAFNFVEISRIDLREPIKSSLNSMHSSLSQMSPLSNVPIDVATRPLNTLIPNPFLESPSFAILGKSVDFAGHSPYRQKGANVVHHVVMSPIGPPSIRRHDISNLENISLIEFSNLHPAVLWSAGRSATPTRLRRGPYLERRPLYGYGHSLQSIDLRSNKANLLWSPSHAEYGVERLHSISGMMTDKFRPHLIYVSSLSAGGRIWQIDCRMPSRAIFSCTLPGLAEDSSDQPNPSGVYGCGTLMTWPLGGNLERDIHTENMHENRSGKLPILPCKPFLNVSKNSTSFGFHLYQEPTSLPRFQTINLECPTYVSNSGIFSGLSFSSTYCLPESSKESFVCGIAAFFSPTMSLFDRNSLDNFDGFKENLNISDSSQSICVVTATSKGDLIGQTLLQRNTEDVSTNVSTLGNLVGSSVLKVPYLNKSSQEVDLRTRNQKVELTWHLQNEYPTSGSSILQTHVSRRAHCRKFETVNFNQIPAYSDNDNIFQSGESWSKIKHPPSDTSMGHLNDDLQSNLPYIPSSYVLDYQNHLNKMIDNEENQNIKSNITDETESRSDLLHTSISTLEKFWQSSNDVKRENN